MVRARCAHQRRRAPCRRAPARERSGSSGSCRPGWNRRAWTCPRPAQAPWRRAPPGSPRRPCAGRSTKRVETLWMTSRGVVHLRSRRPLALGVNEREHLAVADFLHEAIGVHEVLFGLAGESHDDVRGQGDVGYGVTQLRQGRGSARGCSGGSWPRGCGSSPTAREGAAPA